MVDACLRHPQHRRPGTRWHCSNFGVAVLGHALAAATATPWDDLLTGQVLRPLGLGDTALSPGGPDTDATGHRRDGTTPSPGLTIGGFQAAGAVRATPHDLLTFLEAHLDPAGRPLTGALRAVRHPVPRRGLGHRHVHTVAWFQHPMEHGPMYFHCGATLGQQASWASGPTPERPWPPCAPAASAHPPLPCPRHLRVDRVRTAGRALAGQAWRGRSHGAARSPRTRTRAAPSS